MPSDPVRVGRPEAAAAVWNPLGVTADGPARAAKVRVNVAFRTMVAATLGGLFLYFDRVVLGSVSLGVGGLTLIIGLASPLVAYAALDRGALFLGRLIGGALTWLLMAPFYFLVIAPLGLMTKRGARDPMKRRLDADADSYWTKREKQRALDRPY